MATSDINSIRNVSEDSNTNFSKEIKNDATQELPRGVTVSGSLADATSVASTNNIRNVSENSNTNVSKESCTIQRKFRVSYIVLALKNKKKG